MSINTADANCAVLLHSGECIFIHCSDTVCEFSGNKSPEFQGTKVGHTYLTSHRVVFRNRSGVDLLSSISIPFVAMRNVCLKEKSILGGLQAQPNGNFSGEVRFKLTFEIGGATEFLQTLMIASCVAIQGIANAVYPLVLPPYTLPTAWYEAGMSAYMPVEGVFKWFPEHAAFTTPRPNSVCVSNEPPPFPGIDRTSTLDFCVKFGKPSMYCLSALFDLEGSDQLGPESWTFSPMDGIFPMFP